MCDYCNNTGKIEADNNGPIVDCPMCCSCSEHSIREDKRMDTDKQEQMHLDRLMQMDKPEQFGASFVQRNCRVGYNNAMHVLERGVSTGVLVKADDSEFQYRVVL